MLVDAVAARAEAEVGVDAETRKLALQVLLFYKPFNHSGVHQLVVVFKKIFLFTSYSSVKLSRMGL